MNVSVIFLGFPMGFPHLFLCLPWRGIPMSTICQRTMSPGAIAVWLLEPWAENVNCGWVFWSWLLWMEEILHQLIGSLFHYL